MTEEETRALAFNLSLKKRYQACIAREIRLQGNKAAAQGLYERTEAVMREENAKQRRKTGRSEEINFDSCKRNTVNG